MYFAKISNNPYAFNEFEAAYRTLETNPRGLGYRFREDDPLCEHWIYESPDIPGTARIRIYYTINGRLVSIERLDLI